MAIDRKQLVEKVSKGGEIAALSIVPPMAGYDAIKGNPESVEKAKQLLADAGFPGGKGFPKLAILYNTLEAHKKIGEYIQQQWKENLGINVELVNQEWKTYLDTRREGKFDIARAGWIGDYLDPEHLPRHVGDRRRPERRQVRQPEVRRAHQEGGDDEGRQGSLCRAHGQAEELFITQDEAIMPIYFYTNKEMIDGNKWGGWYTNTLGYHPVKYIYKK